MKGLRSRVKVGGLRPVELRPGVKTGGIKAGG